MNKKRTQAQTPAPKKDQVKGSSINKPGSASGSRGGIKISEAIEKALVNLRDKHNDRYKSPSKRVDLGTLKAVYRRGAGAFSTSHRPGMSRDQWGLARVKTFLKLAGTGERKKAYNTDLDLLPKGHPQRSEPEKKTESVALAIPKKYEHIDFNPPVGAQKAAAKALEERSKQPPSNRGMTSVGLARARDLANGRKLSPETVKRMFSYFSRHEVDKKSPDWSNWSKGRQAWEAWGGDAGYSYAKRVVEQMKKADKKMQSLRAYGEAIQLNDNSDYDVPESLTIGKPFKTLAYGQVSSRLSGEKIGKEIDKKLLEEIVRVFKETQDETAVIIDWNHSSSPFNNSSIAPPETSNALGRIIDLQIKDDGLYAIPAYNEKGLDIVKSAGGVLWSSPEYIDGDVYSRSTGEKVGSAQLLAITLTPRPAQSQNKIDIVTLSENLTMDEQILELQAKLEEALLKLQQKDALVKELESKLKDKEELSSMNEHYDDDKKKMSEHEDEEKKSQMMEDEDEDKEKMSEHEDEDEKKKKMNEAALLSEGFSIQMFNEMKRELDIVRDQLHCEKRDKAVQELLNDGRISPSQVNHAKQAFDKKDEVPAFWQMLSEAPKNSAVNLSEIGHSATLKETQEKTLVQKIKLLSEEKSIGFDEARRLYAAQNPNEYSKSFN